jgi:hypothetical protein
LQLAYSQLLHSITCPQQQHCALYKTLLSNIYVNIENVSNLEIA